MSFDFNFPNVSFVEKEKANSAIVIPYLVKDDKLSFNKEYKNICEKFKESLSEKVGSVFSVYDNKTYFVFANVKKEDIEGSIIKSLKAIPDTCENISVIASDLEFYDKLIVSKLMYEMKSDWSLKSKQEKQIKKNIYIVVKNSKNFQSTFGSKLAETQALVQQWVNMPANYLTPTKFAELAKEQVKELDNENLSCKVYDSDYLYEQKMGSFYGVAKGSEEKAKLIVLKYQGNKKTKDNDVVLVGKGLTFDSGGISIKPSLGMGAMKGDMAGAATAISAILYAAKTNLAVNMVVVAACCENMPSGGAVKPGDVLTAMDGTTIEVIDTDAEGRLVLADALCYAKKFEGKYTIDMATLTGACIVALGYVNTGLFTKDDKLAESLCNAGLKMKDKAWRLPLCEEYEEMLESKVADISNLCIGKGAGAQNGAVFLQKFAPKEGWCHLDIAGTSAQKGGEATSRPMAMLSEFLDNLAK